MILSHKYKIKCSIKEPLGKNEKVLNLEKQLSEGVFEDSPVDNIAPEQTKTVAFVYCSSTTLLSKKEQISPIYKERKKEKIAQNHQANQQQH
jgi:hypothetical protein